MQEVVRDASERGPEAAEPASADDDLGGVTRLGRPCQRLDRRSHDDVGLDAGPLLQLARELPGTFLMLVQRGLVIRRAEPVCRRMEGAHRHHVPAALRGTPSGVVERGGRVVGAVVADDDGRRLMAVARRGEAQLALHGAAGNHEHRAVGLVQQRVRGASERGFAKSPEPARPDRDLVRIQLVCQIDQGPRGRPLRQPHIRRHARRQQRCRLIEDLAAVLSSALQRGFVVVRVLEQGRGDRGRVGDHHAVALAHPPERAPQGSPR